MKKFYHLFLAAALTVLAAACTKESGEPELVPPTIEEVSGINTMYDLGLHEFLEITPEVMIDNENTEGLTYEWSVDYNVVSTERDLKYKCSQLGDHEGYFKVVSENGAKIVAFKFYVSSPYDKGLLLLSETKDGAMLTYKRLDKMETPASPLAFKDNNPGLELGKNAYSIAWMGSSLTNTGAAIHPESDLNVYLTTGNPTKVYSIDHRTLKVKTDIVYDGNGTFTPNLVYVPVGFQNGLWDGSVYFLGDGKEYIMTPENTFVEAEMSTLPDGMENVKLSNMVCCTYNEDFGDMPRIYFDENSDRLIIMGGALFSGASSITFPVEPMALLACNGEYRARRYESYQFVFVGHSGNDVKVYHLSTGVDYDTFAYNEVLLSEIDASGKILPESAIGTNPIKPILYYSNGSGIYRLNLDGKNFDAEPYIKLDGNYAVKQIIFNEFDQNTMYVAAENLDEEGEMKASLFVYDVTDKTAAKKLFEDKNVGGSVKQLIYKGNGKEYESTPKEEE